MSDAVRMFFSGYRSALSRLGRRGARRRGGDGQTPAGAPRARLFRKYVLLIVGLVGLVLLINNALDFWVGYEENKAALFRIQQEKAASAAQRIEGFIDEIERQLGWTTAPQWAASPLEQRSLDDARLLRQVPAITELIQLDEDGKEQLKVSRLAMNAVGSEKDFSQSPAFIGAKQHRIWFSPVYFRKESEPYMTLGMAQSGRKAGVTVAEVNLKLIWDVVSGLKIGRDGYAYVVDRDGRLLAHPDISLVLRNTDLSNLPQVAAALAEAPPLPSPAGSAEAGLGQPTDQAVMIAKGIGGGSVLTARAPISQLGWTVFVELPLREALAPLYASALRTAGLLVLALALAALAALLLARRMTGPIRQLQAGAARIGAGELDRRIDIHTGDELEGLAGEFNRMASDLQKSYAGLEKKVEERTAELKDALEQQTATAEVLGVINSSPGDLVPVFDAILEKAHDLCGAAQGGLIAYDGEHFRLIAAHAMPPRFAEMLRQPFRALAFQQRLLAGEPFVHITDMAARAPQDPKHPITRASDEAGIRTLLMVPLHKEGTLLGYITAHREEVRPFTDKQIALLQNFAAQAVIAMENARLLTETREALEQQTATAEVLQVINSSPGDLVPVFDAMLDKALRLCDAAYGNILSYDGERFHPVAVHGDPRLTGWLPKHGSFLPGPGTTNYRILQGERFVHIPDAMDDEPYRRGDPVRRTLVDIGECRALLSVALRKDDALLGVIHVYRREVRPFSEKQIALLENFAAQAVIAMENARLITETREALEQQQAIAEILQVINRSPGELQPVFDILLEKAMELCGAAFGVLAVLEGEQTHTVAAQGLPPALAEWRIKHPIISPRNTLLGRVLAGEPYVHTLDLKDDDLYRQGEPLRRANVDLGGARTSLYVPLLRRRDVLGTIHIYRQEVRPFSEKQIALLQNFAAQAVIAMENARLLTETREALEQQTATAEVLQTINSSPGDLAPVFDAMLDKATRLCEAPFGILRTWNGERFHFGAVHGDPRFSDWVRRRHPIQPEPDNSPLGRILQGERVVHVADVSTDESSRTSTGFREMITESGLRSSIMVALRKEDTLVGAITVYRQEVRPFTDKQIALLKNFAAQAVIAMENARLITETREALDQQTATAEVLQVINSSPGDLAPVFEAMLDRTIRLCEAAHGHLFTYDGECFHPAAASGEPHYIEWARQVSAVRPAPNGPLGRISRGERIVHIADLREEEVYHTDPRFREQVDTRNARSQITVGLLKDNILLGAMIVYRQEVRVFSAKQITLVENFAAQAVIAMENARLLTETREALEQQTATAEALQVINSSPGDLTPVFNAMLDKALTLCGAAFGQLVTFDGSVFRATAWRGYEPGSTGPTTPTPGMALYKLVQGEEIVHIADITADDVYRSGNAVRRRLADEYGGRTAIWVALRKDAALLGAFVIYRTEVRPFSDKQIALLQNFAAQAVIAIENARLLTETREALEQQTATAEVLQVINSSPGDLAPVFDAILEKAHTLCGAQHGSLGTYDGDYFRAVASRGYPAKVLERLRHGFHGLQNPVTRPLFDGARFVQIPDLGEIDHPIPKAVAALGGFRTALFVPLRKDGKLLGHISASRQVVHAFAEKEITLLENFAAQAVIAMENARLITETREALEQQTATAEVLQVINSSPGDLGPVFDAMLDRAMRLCEADVGNFWTYDGEAFTAVAMRDPRPEHFEWARQRRRGGPGSISDSLIRGESVIHIPDAADTDAYRAGEPARRAIVDLNGGRTLLAVALRKGEELLGYINIFRRVVRPFSDKQIALLQNFAAQAVIAMENARLLTETREALEQQTATAEVLQVINSSPGDLAPVFETILEKAHTLCGATYGGLVIRDRDGFRNVAARGEHPGFVERWRQLRPLHPPEGSPLSRLIAGEKFIHLADASADDNYRNTTPPEILQLSEFGGLRTLLMVPLRTDDAFLGIITAYRLEVQPFTDKQIALLQSFAAQAVIAMENARLINETREALEQQTATAEVLQVINSSPGDLAPVFDAMLEKATRLCEAPFGILRTWDSERFHFGAVHGDPQFCDWVRQRGPVRTDNDASLLGRIQAGERVVHIIDAQNDEAYRASAGFREMAEASGIRSAVTVALHKDHSLLGIITVYRREVRPFSDKQIALLQNFAAQAVIAMENARLITETREALDQQTATAEVLGVINSSPGDLAPVFDAMLEKAMRLCGAAFGVFAIYDEEHYRVVANHGVPLGLAEFVRQAVPIHSGSMPDRLRRGEDTIQVADITALGSELRTPGLVAMIELGNARTAVWVALRKDGIAQGFFGVYRQEVRPFTDKQIALLQNFAAQAVIAMENARLITELRQRTRDLQESLEHQTATSDVLKVISQSGAELGPVLDTLVETAARICLAQSGFIFRLQDSFCRMVASYGIPAEYKDFQARNPIAPGRGTLAGRTVLERRAVHIEDAAADPEYTRVEAVQLGRQRTMLGVPLVREDALIGVITLARSHVEPFTEKQIALVTTFADQAVIAIENARLFNELRARTTELGSSVAELKMLNEVAQAVSSTLDLRTVLSTVLNASLGVTWANAGAVFRYSRAERAFRLVEAVGWDEALTRSVREMSLAETETAMGEAVARRMPVQLADTAQRASNPLRDITLAAGFRSALIVPLTGAERTLGAIILMRQEAGEFPPETVRLMQTIASQSVLAIQNARLFREIADKSEQLALASQHKSQFLANMSHELRTPLNAILGYAELLVDGIYGVLPDRPKGVLERIQNNGKHLLALINDVLDLAKIEAGQLTLTLEDYNLPEVVKSVVTATEPLASAKGLKFTTVLQDNLPIAHGDARRVSQVLLNLVGNAIKFTDEGEVGICAMVDRGQFVLTVRDSGPGIAEADQDRIFGEFQQIDNSNTRKKGGTGLGLAISKRMVEMQGGTISVESAIGQGSTFRVVLPVQVEEVMEEAA